MSMTFEKREEIISLYDTYGVLLTDKQKNYFERYYFDDLSITEIASNFEVSRNAVFDQLKRVN
ncbi:MAG: DNA-binding protein, partial [Anaeroplasmataceae bacterium]|nr:DNA-binding protein [Anaeroplasmataceae bacterium]